MKKIVLFLVVQFLSFPQLLLACDGWWASSICASSASTALDQVCELAKNVQSQNNSNISGHRVVDVRPDAAIIGFGATCQLEVTGPNGPSYAFGGYIHARLNVCPPDMESHNGYCLKKNSEPEPRDSCSKGQGSAPINFYTGNKLFVEQDYDSGGLNPLKFTRYYNSQNNKVRGNAGGWFPASMDNDYFVSMGLYVLPTNSSYYIDSVLLSTSPQKKLVIRDVEFPDGSIYLTYDYIQRAVPLGSYNSVWRTNFDRSLYRSGFNLDEIRLHRPNGNELQFERNIPSETFYEPKYLQEQGYEYVVVDNDFFIYVDKDLNREFYDLEGRFVRLETRNGYAQDLTYSDGLLTQVADNQGRVLSFTYDQFSRLETMTDPDGHEYRYSYGMNGLVNRVYYPDEDTEPLNNPQRFYAYENLAYPNAITRIDDNGVVYGSFVYGAGGKAIYSSLANSAGEYFVDYSVANQTRVTNALGKHTVYHYDSAGNLTQVVGEPSTNCLGDSRSFTYDSNHFKISETDKNGNITTYVRDASGREISRTEAFGTPQARTITTEWYANQNLKKKVTEPERIVEYVFDSGGRLLEETITPNSGQ